MNQLVGPVFLLLATVSMIALTCQARPGPSDSGSRTDADKIVDPIKRNDEPAPDRELAGEETKEPQAPVTPPKATYFGVDANDAEAVRQKQRELSEAKFRELFGDEAHREMDFHFPQEEPKEGEKRGVGVKEVLRWMFDMANNGFGLSNDGQTTTKSPAGGR